MSVIDEDIRSGQFHPVYLLYGEEDYLKRQYRERLKKALVDPEDTINLNIWQGKDLDVAELMEQARTLPFFAAHRLIIAEESGLFKAGGQELAEFLPGMAPETVLLFVEDEVDARSRLYKEVKQIGCVLECRRQTQEMLTRWILGKVRAEGKQIQKSAMWLFLDRAGEDMEHISREMEKLLCYTAGRDAVMLEDVQAVTTIRPENRIFDLTDAISVKDRKKALRLYRDFLEQRESPVRILALLYRQFDRLFQIRDLREQGLDAVTIADRMKMRDFVVSKNLRQSAAYTREELRSALDWCMQADEDIKRGRMEDALAVELVIVQATAV